MQYAEMLAGNPFSQNTGTTGILNKFWLTQEPESYRISIPIGREKVRFHSSLK